MLPDVELANVRHEGELVLREGYDPWIHRMIMHSLTDNQIVLDAGCGNMILDDPCIIRMDIKLTPYVDLVGDLHAGIFGATGGINDLLHVMPSLDPVEDRVIQYLDPELDLRGAEHH
jgi:hypothetical protein